MDPRLKPLLAIVLGSLISLPAFGASDTFVVQDIRIEGLQRISPGTVFNYLPFKTGDRVGMGQTQDLIRAVYKTGFFKDVRVERDGNVLVIYVSERPTIAKIGISGNKSIKKDALLKALKDTGLAEGKVFNRSVLERVEQELKRQYFGIGKYAMTLKTTITPLESNRVGVALDIKEGKAATIKQINIVGNKAFKDKTLLKQFELDTGNWLSVFTKSNQYSRQKLGADLEKLRSYYLDRGYINFKIDSVQVSLTPDKHDVYITINLSEGEVHTISDIKLAGDLVLPKEDFFPLIHLHRGEAFSRKQTVESAERITKLLGDHGYAFANVNTIPDINPQTRQVGLTFFVDPGKRVYVRRITFTGNTRTRDEVLRREFRQMESAWFSTEKVNLSKTRLERLGYFDSVSVETPAVAATTDQIDVNVKVKEKPSGQLLAGIGFSQSQGLVFSTSISEKNFLGTGKQVSFAFNNSSAQTIYQLGYVNPYYTVDGVSRGFNLRYQTSNYADMNLANYSTDVADAGVIFGIPVSELNRIGVTFDVSNTDLKLGQSASRELQDFVDTQGDQYLDYKLGVSWGQDSRDSALFPTRGATQSLGLETAIPGSDLTYYKINYVQKRYVPLTQDFTLSLTADLGYGDSYGSTERLPFFEDYFAGGHNTVRGFKDYSLGPRDSNGQSLGGNVKVVGSAELLAPLPFDVGRKSVRLGAFFDAGNVFDTVGYNYGLGIGNRQIINQIQAGTLISNLRKGPIVKNIGGGNVIKNLGGGWLVNGVRNIYATQQPVGVDLGELRYSAGVGVSWLSPIGALTFSVAYPLNAKPTDDVQHFQFNFGKSF